MPRVQFLTLAVEGDLDPAQLAHAVAATLTLNIVEAPAPPTLLEAPPLLVVRAYVNAPVPVYVAPDPEARRWTVNPPLFVDVHEIRGSWWKVYPAPGRPGRELWLHGGQFVIC